MDSLVSSTNMETICSSTSDKPSDDREPKISCDGDRPKVLPEKSSILEPNLKVKRCKHGRIIIKNLSKKKLVQQDDKDTIRRSSHHDPASQATDLNHVHEDTTLIKIPSPDRDMVESESSSLNDPSITVNNNNNSETSNNNTSLNCGSPFTAEIAPNSKLESTVQDQDSNDDANRGRKDGKAPTRRRSCSPARRRNHSRSPNHRASPERDRKKSSRDKYRERSGGSPRRKDNSRSPRSNRRDSKRTSSRKRSRQRSPKRDRASPINYREHKRSSRNRSPRRHLSRSRSSSRSRSRSAGRYNARSSRNYSRTPDRDNYRRSRSQRDVDRVSRRVEDKNAEHRGRDKSNQLIGDTISRSTGPTLKDILQAHVQHASISSKPSDSKSSQKPETSPKESLSARSPLSPSSSGSISSDIYDPEGPIVPISPGDSPPFSPPPPPSPPPPNNAAQNKPAHRLEGDKNNEDDVPSSAVQLNQQEKYLQKLNRQERVIEEVKIALKPYYSRRTIDKEQYKDVLRRAVPKVCHSKNGEINPVKIRGLVEAYVKKMKRRK